MPINSRVQSPDPEYCPMSVQQQTRHRMLLFWLVATAPTISRVFKISFIVYLHYVDDSVGVSSLAFFVGGPSAASQFGRAIPVD